MSGSSHHQSSGDSSWRPGKQGLHRGPPYWRREILLLTQKQPPKRSGYEAENSQTLAFSSSLQSSLFTYFLGGWYISITSITFPTSIPLCWLPRSMTTLSTIIIGITTPLPTVLGYNQRQWKKTIGWKSWVALMSFLHAEKQEQEWIRAS